MAELAARVQHRHDNFHGRFVLSGMVINGDTTAVIRDAYPAIGKDGYFDVMAVPGEGFINRVVHDLVHQVVQAALPGGANVHTRALTHCLEALQHRNVGCIVGLARIYFSNVMSGFR